MNSLLAGDKIKNAKISIRVVSLLDKGAVLYDKNSRKLMIPASTNKVVSGAAAIDSLGPLYTFKTSIYYNGTISPGGKLNGDLYIVGGGDPSISLENAWLIAHKIKSHGITSIEGHLVGDDSFFDDVRHYSDWGKVGTRAYHAPMGALSVNFNTIGVYVAPGHTAGSKANATLDPRNDLYTLENHLVTSSSGRTRVAISFKDKTCFVTGKIPVNLKGRYFHRSITAPLPFALSTFKEFLKQEGVLVVKGYKKGALPSSARLLFIHQSKPLSLIIRDLYRNSNNFTAECTARTLGAEKSGGQGTQKSASVAIEGWLKEKKFYHQGVVIKDASGLSRGNRLSSKVLVDVLAYMWNKPEVSPEFIDAMAIGGIDGTLKRRFKGTPLYARVRAKSGLLWGVITLAGYCYDKENNPYAFSILVNDYDKSASARDIQRLAEKMLNIMMK